MRICEYGCGQEARYYLKFKHVSNKWCCSKLPCQCLKVRERNKKKNLGKKRVISRKIEVIQDICSYGCGQEAKYKFKNRKVCCSKSQNSCPGVKRVHSKIKKGMNNPFFGKSHSKETIKKISEFHKGKMFSKRTIEKIKGKNNHWFLTISKIKKRYPFFSQIEELRYNPDKPGEKEIQVHCKNHLCPNSKEQNGWFTPKRENIYTRIGQLEHPDGNDGSYFYCSEECKKVCPLYRLRSDPYKSTDYSREVQPELRELRLEIDNYQCQKCGKTIDEVELHCHHIEGVRWEPLESADLDKVITLCKNCHIEVHKIEGCRYSDLQCNTGE